MVSVACFSGHAVKIEANLASLGGIWITIAVTQLRLADLAYDRGALKVSEDRFRFRIVANCSQLRPILIKMAFSLFRD